MTNDMDDTAWWLSRCDMPDCPNEGTEPYMDGFVCHDHLEQLADRIYERMQERANA